MPHWLLTDLPEGMRRQAEQKLAAQIRTIKGKDTADDGDGPSVRKPKSPHESKQNKYNARRIRVNEEGGKRVQFDSKHEYKCYLDQKVRERAGEIEGLRVHVKFSLFDPGENCRGEHFGTYTSDFCWREKGKFVVADAKSSITKARRDWKRTKQLMKACHGIEVIEL